MSIPSMFDRSNGSVGTGGSWMGDDSIAPWLPLMGLGQGSVPHGGGPQLDPYTSPLPGGNLSLKQLVDMYGAKPSEPSPPPDNTHYQMAMFHMAKGQLLSQMQDMQSAQARGEGTGVSHEMYARLSGIDQQLQRLQGVASLQAASPPAAQNALTAGEIDRRRQLYRQEYNTAFDDDEVKRAAARGQTTVLNRDGVEVGIHSPLRLYQLGYGQPMQIGQSNEDYEAYTNYGQLPPPQTAQLGGYDNALRHSGKVFQGIQRTIGGLGTGLVSAQQRLGGVPEQSQIGSLSMDQRKKVDEAFGTGILKTVPMVALPGTGAAELGMALASSDPVDMLQNLAGAAVVGGATKIAGEGLSALYNRFGKGAAEGAESLLSSGAATTGEKVAPVGGRLSSIAEPDDLEAQAGYPLRSNATPEAVAGSAQALERLGQKPTIHAQWLKRGLETGEGQSLIGGTVNSPEDLATLAQTLRDPRFETLRYFFTKNGEIVGHGGFSTRMAGTTAHFFDNDDYEGLVNWLKEKAAISKNANGESADGFYLLHNHPSGNPTPSEGDYDVTNDIAGMLRKRGGPTLHGHVIIDSNQYAFFEPNSKGIKPIQKMFFDENGQPVLNGGSDIKRLPNGMAVGDPLRPQNAEDMLDPAGPESRIQPADLFPIMGRQINSTQEIAHLGRDLRSPEDWVAMVGRDTPGRVQSLSDFPKALLTDSSPWGNLRTIGEIRKLSRGSGTSAMYAVLPSFEGLTETQHSALETLLERKALANVFDYDGLSYRASRRIYKPFEPYEFGKRAGTERVFEAK
jgi:hypothetical protein